MFRMKVILFLFFYHCSVLAAVVYGVLVYAPVVQTSFGKVRGIVETLDDNSTLYLYKGIKYGIAKRFQKPEFVKPWKGILDAIQSRDACPQPNKRIASKDIEYESQVSPSSDETISVDDLVFREAPALSATDTISEDCLFLNVWQPLSKECNLLPVMVWVHGGSFRSGSIFYDAYDGRYIAQKGSVIVVGINYRLGPFGFLYAGTEHAPGNQGLHDQILALKWVQKNIQHFGGDPNRVTLFGESAGSMSVGTLVLSPLTDNLFRRAILQSGAPNSFIGTGTKEQALGLTRDFAKRLRCPTMDIFLMIKCLRRRRINEILEAGAKDYENLRLMHPIHGDELMPISPVAALKNAKKLKQIDLMFGVTMNEGSEFVTDLFPILGKPEKSDQVTLESSLDMIRKMMKMVNYPNVEEVVKFYQPPLQGRFKGDYFNSLVADAFGDYLLICPTMLFGKYFARARSANPERNFRHYSYSYRLAYPLKHGPFSAKYEWQGVIHGEDFVYLFIIPNNRANYTPQEVKLSDDMIKAWTKFAHHGHPSIADKVVWTEAFDLEPPANSSVRFMELDPTKYGMVENEYQKRCDEFWEPRIFRDDDEKGAQGRQGWLDRLWSYLHWFFWV